MYDFQDREPKCFVCFFSSSNSTCNVCMYCNAMYFRGGGPFVLFFLFIPLDLSPRERMDGWMRGWVEGKERKVKQGMS